MKFTRKHAEELIDMYEMDLEMAEADEVDVHNESLYQALIAINGFANGEIEADNSNE